MTLIGYSLDHLQRVSNTVKCPLYCVRVSVSVCSSCGYCVFVHVCVVLFRLDNSLYLSLWHRFDKEFTEKSNAEQNKKTTENYWHVTAGHGKTVIL